MVIWIGGCGRSSGPTKKKAAPTGATGGSATQTERQSVGWQSSTTPDPPGDLERAKLERERAEKAAKGIGVPPELAGRTKPKAPSLLDVYVDGKPQTSLVASRFDAPLPLTQALGQLPIRNVFVHASDHNVWISAPTIESYSLRRNRRGMIKLEVVDTSGRGKGDGTGRATRTPDAAPSLPGAGSRRAVRDREIRGVQWIEIRTQTSARLDQEPG